MDTTSLEFWFRLLTQDSPPLGRIICMVEGDNVYHVETRWAGRFFSATPGQGVRFADEIEHQDDSGYWSVVRVPEPVSATVASWAASIVGQPYDFFGALNSALGIPARDPYRWFCSLVGEEIATRSGIGGLDALPDPSTLCRQLQSHAGIISASAIAKYPVAGLQLADEDERYLASLVDSRLIDTSLAQKVLAACQPGA